MNMLIQASIERLGGGHCAKSAPTGATKPDGFVSFAATRRSIRTVRTGGLAELLEARVLLAGYALNQIFGSFGANASGAYPGSTLVMDSNGNFYGTASGGGASSDGTVFEIAKGWGAITALASFNGDDGANPYAGNPYAGVTLDASGNLYGTTEQGGPGNAGTVFELATNTLVLVGLSGGANPSNATEPLTFTAAVSDGVPNGQTLSLVDASNNDAVLASGTVSNAFATLTVPAGTLTAGTHNLIAVYGGDASHGASESAPYAQTVQVAVTGVSVNGNLPNLAGAQRSMVDSIVYSFSEAVKLSSGAVSLAIHSGQSGILPTSLTWTALHPNGDGSSTQWALSFSGAGVTGGSIADGVYDITLNAADVTSDANPSVIVQPRSTDTFYRLYGDLSGAQQVNNADYGLFVGSYGLKPGQAGYLAALDASGTGSRINNADYRLLLANYNKKLSGFKTTL